MKRLSLSLAGLALGAGLAFSSAAHAQDGVLTTSGDLFFNGTFGGGVLTFSGSSNVSKTFYGLDASGEVCRTTVSGIDLCGGVNVFHALGGKSKTTAFGPVTMTTKTDLTTVGGFVKVRKQMEQIGVAPYVGLRRILSETTVTGLGAPTTLKDNANAAYGGVELDYSLVEDRVFVSLKAEVGRSFGAQTNRTMFLLSPGLKVRF